MMDRKISFSLSGKREDLVLFVDRINKTLFKLKPNSLMVDIAIVNLNVGDSKYRPDVMDGDFTFRQIKKMTKIKLTKEFKGWQTGSEFILCQKTKHWCFGITEDGVQSGPLPLLSCELTTEG